MDIKNVTSTTRLKWITHIVSLQLTAIIIGFVISTLFDRKLTSLMTWHQILCPMGCAVFMLEGILLFGPYHPLTFGYKRMEIWNIHAIIAGLGTVCMSLGTIFVIVAKSTHFTSLHGILGLTAWIVCLLATILGILVKFKVLKSLLRPIIFKFIHVLLGLTGFILSVIVNSLGFYKGYGRRPGPEAAVITIVSLGGAFVCILSTRTLFARTQGLLNSN